MPSSSYFPNKILEKLSGLDDDRLLVMPVESPWKFPNIDLEIPYPVAKSMSSTKLIVFSF